MEEPDNHTDPFQVYDVSPNRPSFAKSPDNLMNSDKKQYDEEDETGRHKEAEIY